MSSIGTPAVGVSGPFAPKVEVEPNPVPSFPVVQLDDGVRIFSNPHIQSVVDEAMRNMDEGDRYVIVAHHVYDNDGQRIENVTKVSAIFKLTENGKWSIGVGAYKDWSGGDLGAEAKIVLKG